MRSVRTFLAAPLFVPVIAILSGCNGDVHVQQPLLWTFHLNDSTTLSLDGYSYPDSIVLLNGPERLTARATGTGTYLLPPFDGIIEGTWDNEQFEGHWNDQLREAYTVRLTATPATQTKQSNHSDIPTSSWDLYLPASDSTPMGTLLLRRTNELISGTVATPTGDMRHLRGTTNFSRNWKFGTFDGAHLYQFIAVENDSVLSGTFYSGIHYSAPFRAIPRQEPPTLLPEEAAVLDAVPFHMHWLTPDGTTRTWTLDSFPADVVVIDIMGTWCPNCLDEIRLLKKLAATYTEAAFLSIAFERNADDQPDAAQSRIQRYRDELEIPWDMHLGGPASKRSASQAFPFLREVKSFPTTLFIHRDGRIITHSGFNGPATGPAYQLETETFNTYLDSLLQP